MNLFIPEIMLTVPWYLWPPVGLILLFVYFCFVVEIRDGILRNGWQFNKFVHVVAKVLFYDFLKLDVIANYLCWSPIALHFSWEHKTITAHAKWLIKTYVIFTETGKPVIKAGFRHSWRVRWAVKFAVFTIRQLHNIDPIGH